MLKIRTSNAESIQHESDHLLKHIGRNLHTIRNARKETLKSVAHSIRLTHPTLSKIENGRYKNLQIIQLLNLCKHYQVSLYQVCFIELHEYLNHSIADHNSTHNHAPAEVNSEIAALINELRKQNETLKVYLEKVLNQK